MPNQLYKGSTQIGYIVHNGKIIKQEYHGRNLIYEFQKSITFSPSSELQSLVIPQGFHRVRVDCVASKGKDASVDNAFAGGGAGGRVQCFLSVNGGDTLYVMVGDIPTSADPSYNASDIRIRGTELSNRIIVAGGGGGGAISTHYNTSVAAGGNGGGTIGESGHFAWLWGYSATAGVGGNQSSGGAGATAACPYVGTATGDAGVFGLGGAPHTTGGGTNYGAGGAGWYGGGGSATSSFADEKTLASAVGSAGGGSSYTHPTLCFPIPGVNVHTQGYQNGAGYVTISLID